MATDNSFYVYLHIKKDCGSPFYVGKGKKNRSTGTHNRSKFWNNIVNKYGFDVILLEEKLTEEVSLEREVYWINRIGRRDLGTGPLVNLTSGGEGASGRIKSFKERAAISERNRNRIYSDETKKKLSIAMKERAKTNPTVGSKNGMYGKKHTQATKDKMSFKKRGSRHPNSKSILDLETGIIYKTISECAKANNIPYRTLLSGLKTDLNKYKKYKRL